MRKPAWWVAAAVVGALLAVSPPISAAAEQTANLHFAQHQVLLLLGILLGGGVRLLPASGRSRATDVWVLLAALVLQLLWNSPPVDSWADGSTTTHFTLHGLVFVTGAVFGWALGGLVPTRADNA